jgi:uncharacterized protein (TIGR02996 family)
MRTFQFSDAKSHKFWNIDVQGIGFTVTYGKVGTAGQSQIKRFASAAKAQSEAAKLVREKTAKGYRETTPKAAASQEEALERAVIADPDDQTPWSALADYLTEQGDPRGEFMQVQRALEIEDLSLVDRNRLRRRERELLATHEKEWVGDWADPVEPPNDRHGAAHIEHTGGRKYDFKRGLLTTANFGELRVEAARAFVKAPQTRFVRELFIGGHPYDDDYESGPDIPDHLDPSGGAADLALFCWPHLRNVRRFQLGWMEREDYTDYCPFHCQIDGDHSYDFVKQMPEVEEILVFAHFRDAKKLMALPLPKLRVLQLYHGYGYPLGALAKNPSLTKLTHLLCHPHAQDDEEAYIRLRQLKAVCRSEHLKSLTHLRLRLADFGDAGAREIVDSGILKRLKVLDLRHGNITDEGAKVLAGCPDLRNLDQLDVSRNGLTREGMNALLATGVRVDLQYQHSADEDEEYMYQGDIE